MPDFLPSYKFQALLLLHDVASRKTTNKGCQASSSITNMGNLVILNINTLPCQPS